MTLTDWVSVFTVWTVYTALTIIVCVGVAMLALVIVKRIGIVLTKSIRADAGRR